MKNWAAVRRRSRSVDNQRRPVDPAPNRPGLSGPPTAILDGLQVWNAGGAGIVIGSNARVQSKGLKLINNRVGIINAGEFDGPDTIIK